MLFNSIQFAFFLPIVVAIYFTLPQRARTAFLLIASCVFYMAFIPAYIFILLITILIDYTAGILLERTAGKARLALLLTSIVATCVVLFIFKYYNFFMGSFAWVANMAGWHVESRVLYIILPIGLSFHTFQSLSYVIEVYAGRQKAEWNFITYATYVMFFPQLVAGPIERPQNLLHQFYERHEFDYDRVTSGLKRIAWGLFKKIVVADRLALYVNDVYAAPRNYNGLQLSIATFFFAYQIYCDFSGYSDIAIGSARILGFELMENFNTPYYSRSIAEFWRRWHISLSTWFRDYVYRPLGGNRLGQARVAFNLLVTFLVSGLWHGANWTYVVWGLLNGVYMVFGKSTKALRSRVYEVIGMRETHWLRHSIGVASTFVLTCLAWIVFCAKSLPDALYIFSHLWVGWDLTQVKTPQFQLKHFPAAILGIVLLEVIQLVNRRRPITITFGELAMPVRWAGYAAFVFTVILFGVFRQTQFIYFQF